MPFIFNHTCVKLSYCSFLHAHWSSDAEVLYISVYSPVCLIWCRKRLHSSYRFLQKLIIAQAVKTFPAFYEGRPLFPQHITGPCPQPDESRIYPYILLFKINFNIILPLRPDLPRVLSSSGFPTEILYAFSISTLRATCSPPL